MNRFAKITHDGPRNAAIQITGSGLSDWVTVVDTQKLRPVPRKIRLDAVYYAVSDGLEVQLAWHSLLGRLPFLPLSGRGKIDFGEVSGLVNTTEDESGHIEMRVTGAAGKDKIYSIILDLSKHIGEQNG